MTKSAMDKYLEWLEYKERREISTPWRMAYQKCIEEARRLLSEEQAQKPTAPASRERLAHCPTCQGEIKSTERRPDGDSVCINGHKHKTAEFFRYRPSPSSADEGLYHLECVVKVLEGKCNFIPDCKSDRAYHDGLVEALGEARAFLKLARERHPAPKENKA